MSARGRRWLAPEVVQTSSMDCGPAALKCLLEGHRIPVSYGRLREACQTDVDGTSIDTIETVARQLGLDAEQEMLPAEHLVDARQPALVVVRQADAATHFVVVWRRVGRWLQVMDPAAGRRWVDAERFGAELYRHRAPVDAAAWRAWAGESECRRAIVQRLVRLGADRGIARRILASALADAGWRCIATLDAALRLVQSLCDAGGVVRGAEAVRLVGALSRRSLAEPAGAGEAIPAVYWSVRPLAHDRLELQGAVALRIAGRATDAQRAGAAPLPPDLAAALAEKPAGVWRAVWQTLREDGLLQPLALAGAALLAGTMVMLQALLLRGLFDIGTLLALPGQRALALGALLAFLALGAAFGLPILAQTLRQGRHLELRLRIALLRKLPRLHDRYFQSRPISDMADRSHGLHATRAVPVLGLQLVQSAAEVVLVLGGIAWLAPAMLPGAALLVVVGAVLPLLTQPLLVERDLRARHHGAALNGFYLDALLGLVPVRAHRAERSVATQHEGLLVDWARAVRSGLAIGSLADAAQSLVCTTAAALLLVLHFVRSGSVGGADLLLVFWMLRLPAIGGGIASLVHQLPAQRNVLMRLLEPLGAPQEPHAEPLPAGGTGALALAIERGRVVAGGHEILAGVDVSIAPGEHVAIVGSSGAGKSSLVGVLLGWHRLAEGRLSIDGVPVGHGAIESLRRVTAWVDPAVQIWNRSLLDNLAYASDAPAGARASAALSTAQLRGTLERLPQGLQTLLGEGGTMLSGGEGQRLRLARALLASGTRLALLDEPFRGLDREQRRALLAEARVWWKDTTLLCVTHDLAETLAFDRVLVVEGGRIVEDGTPRELAMRVSRYRALLEAERRVHAGLWRGPQWRRLTVREGRVLADAAAETNPGAAVR